MKTVMKELSLIKKRRTTCI